MNMRIYISNLGAYNRGHLVGRWVDLPIDEDDLREIIKDVLNGEEAIKSRDFIWYEDEEIAIHDYELPFEISEYSNIFELNELAEDLEEIEEDSDIVEVIADELLGNGYDKDTLIDVLLNREYYIVYNVVTDYELGLETYRQCQDLLPFPAEIIDKYNIESFIDFESIGIHMGHDGWQIYSRNGKYFALRINV